jgi:hypothetical protein
MYIPGTTGINAFDQHWGQENNWIVPPPSVAQICIQKMKQETANGTIIIPYWKSAPYWPLIYTNIVVYILSIPSRRSVSHSESNISNLVNKY